MKLSVLQSNLSKALNTVSRTVSNKTTLPILSHVALNAQKGRLKVSATNLEIGINFYIGGKIDKPGQTTVPARIFTEFVSSLKEDKITLELKDSQINVKTNNVESNFSTENAEEFPLIPDIKDKKSLNLNGKDLKEAISLVSLAAASDETRPILSGVLMKVVDKKLILAATDSYRLAEKVINLTKKPETDFEIIVPSKTLMELFRILSDFEENVDVYIGENQIAFQVGDIELVSRLIEGQFPNYLQIIPDDNQTKALLNTNEFMQALKVSYLFARESANTVKIEFGKDSIKLTSQAQSLGDNTYVIKTNVEGSEGEISFNAKYLIDVLSVLKDDKIKVEISGKLNPGLVRPTKTEGYLYIVMPLRN